jgi:hypothetical protein
LANRNAVFAGRAPEKNVIADGCSLSLRERVRVRGNRIKCGMLTRTIKYE